MLAMSNWRQILQPWRQPATALTPWLCFASTMMLLLIGYCLGHTLWLRQAPQFALTLTWASAHAIAVCGMLYLLSRNPRSLIVVITALIMALLMARLLIGRLDYDTVMIYLGVAIGFCYSIRRQVNSTATPTLEVDFGRMRQTLSVNHIIHLQGARNYVEVHTRQRSGLVRSTLNDLSQQLPPDFIQTHRSHWVRRQAVTAVEHRKPRGVDVVLTNGSRVPVARRYQQRVMDTFVPATADSSLRQPH
ncbi:MAG: hypothetical protein Tsb002_02470 [Wenzhouxiangellaceae bacterium]